MPFGQKSRFNSKLPEAEEEAVGRWLQFDAGQPRHGLTRWILEAGRWGWSTLEPRIGSEGISFTRVEPNFVVVTFESHLDNTGYFANPSIAVRVPLKAGPQGRSTLESRIGSEGISFTRVEPNFVVVTFESHLDNTGYFANLSIAVRVPLKAGPRGRSTLESRIGSEGFSFTRVEQ